MPTEGGRRMLGNDPVADPDVTTDADAEAAKV